MSTTTSPFTYGPGSVPVGHGLAPASTQMYQSGIEPVQSMGMEWEGEVTDDRMCGQTKADGTPCRAYRRSGLPTCTFHTPKDDNEGE